MHHSPHPPADGVVPALIEARALTSGYGSTTVVHEVDLSVQPGQVVAMLGPNGAGKTTTLLTLAGELQAQRGEVRMRGRTVTSPCHKRARQGLGYITEERSVFMGLTVAENLRLARVAIRDAV